MRTHQIVILAPAFKLVTYISQRKEHFDVQAFITQPAIKRLDVAILDPAGPAG